MPIEIKVAPPSIIISQGRTFMVTNQRGEIEPACDEGVYAIDTRFISTYRLYICRQPWKLVNSSQLSFYASRIHLTNPRIATEEGDLNEHTISLTLERTVGEGIHEDYYVVNYAGKEIRIVLELALRSDFADIFEVKTKRFVQRGRVQSRWDEKESQLRTTYTDNDFPALYPGGANIPQAWASGSIFQMLQTILGIRADAPHKRLYVNPTLPEWLPELQIQRLGVGNCAIDLRFWREADRSRWEVNKLTAVEGKAQGDMIQVLDEVQSNDRVP